MNKQKKTTDNKQTNKHLPSQDFFFVTKAVQISDLFYAEKTSSIARLCI